VIVYGLFSYIFFYGALSYLYQGILSGILSGIYSDIPAGILSGMSSHPGALHSILGLRYGVPVPA
jgi:hypothetical protein